MGYSEVDELPGAEARWDDFRAFGAIANSSSIKRAAAKLGITQSALSKRLSRLELSLGARLFDRGPTGTTLTYQGERVFSRVQAAQKEFSRAVADAQDAEGRVEGDCSLLMGDGVANYWLAYFLPAFFDRYPHIELKIVLNYDIGAARNQVFDIRMHYYEPVDPAQIMKPIATAHFVPFASQSYLAKHGTPRSIADLASHRILDQAQHLVGKGAWSSWFDSEALNHTALFANQSAFLAKCVREGVGIGLMPTYMVLTDSTIVPLDLGITFPAKLFASYHRDRVTKHPVKTTLEFLRHAVFVSQSMPWFDDEFQFPDETWAPKFAASISHATMNWI